MQISECFIMPNNNFQFVCEIDDKMNCICSCCEYGENPLSCSHKFSTAECIDLSPIGTYIILGKNEMHSQKNSSPRGKTSAASLYDYCMCGMKKEIVCAVNVEDFEKTRCTCEFLTSAENIIIHEFDLKKLWKLDIPHEKNQELNQKVRHNRLNALRHKKFSISRISIPHSKFSIVYVYYMFLFIIIYIILLFILLHFIYRRRNSNKTIKNIKNKHKLLKNYAAYKI